MKFKYTSRLTENIKEFLMETNLEDVLNSKITSLTIEASRNKKIMKVSSDCADNNLPLFISTSDFTKLFHMLNKEYSDGMKGHPSFRDQHEDFTLYSSDSISIYRKKIVFEFKPNFFNGEIKMKKVDDQFETIYNNFINDCNDLGVSDSNKRCFAELILERVNGNKPIDKELVTK